MAEHNPQAKQTKLRQTAPEASRAGGGDAPEQAAAGERGGPDGANREWRRFYEAVKEITEEMQR
ncbi:hypothetical protein [Paenibacillus arenilitoris]|uniref:Uncharacterized protein n=1 Tax=Paenibacillus arenilitoris TaxID=2772299 RepID=A0A927H9F3_9BACL|nr:hypothetical protein [Paenibacillus arenilitoris]MBD2871549.1 hypothetical protein [Paenibacillus arenilitoris]